MKIWNRTEYDNGNVGLLVTADFEELLDLHLDGDPYDIISTEDAPGNKKLVVCKIRDLTNIVEVLDHGYVRYIEHMGDDLSIVRAARVSYDADWRAGEDEGSDGKLIRYLMRNKHTSPFEAVQITFEIKVPIFIARQWHRHRTWAYNEVSARYTEMDMGYYLPDPVTLGVQGTGNKQVRIISDTISEGELEKNKQLIKWMEMQNDAAFKMYKKLLEDGVPRELARAVLPVASYTRYFGSVNLHNLFHFLRLRLGSHAQWEVREYANALLEITRTLVPVAVDAFERTLEDD